VITDTDAYCIPMQDLISVFSVLLLVWLKSSNHLLQSMLLNLDTLSLFNGSALFKHVHGQVS